MKQPRTAIRSLLLPVMQATPNGASIADYARQIGYSRAECSKASSMLLEAGKVCWLQNGMHKHWTAAEHAETLAARVAAETEERREEKRLRDLECDRRRRGWKGGTRIVKTGGWQIPVNSVWELACR
jgi:hypothetical protein